VIGHPPVVSQGPVERALGRLYDPSRSPTEIFGGADRHSSTLLHVIAENPALIIQVPRGSAVERQLREDPPPALGDIEVLVQTGATDERGVLEPPIGGEIVLSVPSPEALERQGDDVQRVIRQAGTGTAPLVIVVEAAELFRQEDLEPVVEAVARADRPVILRIIRPSETA
jgi:hypothetical protein